MMFRTLTAATAGLLVAAGLSAAAHTQDSTMKMTPAAAAGTVEIHSPWSRASAGMARAGGAFMTLVNTGDADRALVSAASDVADTVELHTHIKEGDVMKMRPVDHVAVPAGETVMLQPGGYHVMLIGLHAPLKEGESFDITLTFDNGDTATVTTDIKAAGAMPAGGGMKH
jgi:copper(I)-binding protein